MPELPEVETVRADLSASVCGYGVVRVRLLCEGMLLGGWPEGLAQAAEGATITGFDRVGKALIMRFSSGYSLIFHFRMTGQLYPVRRGAELPTHTRTVFELSDGRWLLHVDVRRLGTLELVATCEESSAATLANVGRDALNDPPRASELGTLLARRKCAVKVLLLDQRCVAGIGNIYACEILARARICPETLCCELRADDVRRLSRAMRYVLREAVRCRGTTISDYRTGTGAAGGFQHDLRVYGREGDRCLRRGCPGIIARVVQGQRSTYYCPQCQQAAPAPGRTQERQARNHDQ